MPSPFASNRTVLRAALLLPGASTLLLMAVAPGREHSPTTVAIIALVIATGAIVWTTWRHAQPVASLRQELYDINHPAAADTGSSWQRWVAAGDRSDARGRALAVFGLSAAISAIIVYAWFA
jgi:hypothetical protein